MKLCPSCIMFKDFESKYIKLNPDFYNELITDRSKNLSGNDKASDLIIEIARLSAFFASEKSRKNMNDGAAYCIAFRGWQLSEKSFFHKKDFCRIDKYIKENIKYCLKDVASQSESVYSNKKEISWILFCCAMIRLNLYGDYSYKLISMNIDYDNSIKVEYSYE